MTACCEPLPTPHPDTLTPAHGPGPHRLPVPSQVVPVTWGEPGAAEQGGGHGVGPDS